MRTLLALTVLVASVSVANAQMITVNVPAQIYGGEGTVAMQLQSNGGGQIWCVDIAGDPSMDGLNDLDNVYFYVDLGAASGYGNSTMIEGVGWDLCIESVGQSYLSDASILFSNVDGQGYVLQAARLHDYPGTSCVSSGGVILLSDLGLPDSPLPDGRLYVQLFEVFDDAPDAPDAYYRPDSSLCFYVTPEPASLLLLALGGVVFLRRR